MKILFLTPQLPYPPRQGTQIRNFHLLKAAAASTGGPALLCPARRGHRERQSAARAVRRDQAGAGPAAKAGRATPPARRLSASPTWPIGSAPRALPPPCGACWPGTGTIPYRWRASRWPGTYPSYGNAPRGHGLSSTTITPSTCSRGGPRPSTCSAPALAQSPLLPGPVAEAATVRKPGMQGGRRRAGGLRGGRSRAEELRTTRVAVVPNGVDTEYYRPDPAVTREPATLLFTGTMDYRPNVDAVRWFALDVLPMVAEHRPDIKLDIVGRSPAPAVLELASGRPHGDSDRPRGRRPALLRAVLRVRGADPDGRRGPAEDPGGPGRGGAPRLHQHGGRGHRADPRQGGAAGGQPGGVRPGRPEAAGDEDSRRRLSSAGRTAMAQRFDWGASRHGCCRSTTRATGTGAQDENG